MTAPLMPKATAVWLIENTALSFDQISEFCGLHELEVQGIADGDVAIGMQGYDPIDNNQLTKDEIKRLLENSKKTLDHEYETSAKTIKDKLESAKKKTLDKI